MKFRNLTIVQNLKQVFQNLGMFTLIDYSIGPSPVLTQPITAKNTCYLRNSTYRVGSSCMQGWRPSMEDCHIHILSLPDDPGTAFFGVYDGHGGPQVADYAGKHLHKFILRRPEYAEGDIAKAIRNGFLDIDDDMFDKEYFRSSYAGTTAVITIIKDNKLCCGNVGDSRAIASVNGKVVQLSYDHKPDNPEEYHRINAAGGWVTNSRVNGNLALSRALGDFSFKRDAELDAEKQIVTAYPDVISEEVTPEWDFVLLACDGIWDVMSNEDAAAHVIEHVAAGVEPDEICERLMNRCLAPDQSQVGGIGCDNMTVVIVCMLHGAPYEQLQKKCKGYARPIGKHGDCRCKETGV